MTVDLSAVYQYANLSAIAYETNLLRLKDTLDHLDFELVDTFTAPGTDTNGYVARAIHEPITVVAFRGTSSLKDAGIDADAVGVVDSGLPGSICVHAGFLKSWIDVAKDVDDRIAATRSDNLRAALLTGKPTGRVVFTGHSLGGALATLAALHWQRDNPQSDVSVFTYGSPRVGFKSFARLFDDTFPDVTRVVHDDDLVPQVPVSPFCHCGTELRIDNAGNLIGPVKQWWRRLLGYERELVDDLDGCALKEHFISNYLLAIEAAIAKANVKGVNL